MGGNSTEVIGAAAAGALAMLLLVGLVVLARRRRHRRTDLEAALEAARLEAAELRARLDELTRGPAPTPAPPARRKRRQETPEFLITDAGASPSLLGSDGTPVEPVVVPDRIVLSATFGAPLVKVAAFGHGVRRALSPENRNRIGFEMRREVRAARKRRRALLKEYQRNIRAEDRAREGLA